MDAELRDAEIRAKAKLTCHHLSGTCSAILNPDREPCDRNNCAMMKLIDNVRALLAPTN